MSSSCNISVLASSLALHERAVALVGELRNRELALALVLGEMERSGAFRAFASSIGDYARQIGLGRGKGRQLCVIGRALPSLPQLHLAMESGRVPWTAAFEVARVAVPETEAEWIGLAEQWPVRELHAAVSAAEVGDPAPLPDARPRLDVTSLRFDLVAEDAQLVSRAMALLRARAGAAQAERAGARLSDEEVLVQMAQLVVSVEAPAQNIGAERFTTVIRECPSCDSAELAGLKDGSVAEVSATTRAMARCDSAVVDVRGDAGSAGRGQSTVSPRVRRLVFDRDNYRCAVPGCCNGIFLDVHHVVHRENGGSHEVANLVLLCSTCHARTHDGYLGISADGRGGFEFASGPEKGLSFARSRW